MGESSEALAISKQSRSHLGLWGRLQGEMGQGLGTVVFIGRVQQRRG